MKFTETTESAALSLLDRLTDPEQDMLSLRIEAVALLAGMQSKATAEGKPIPEIKFMDRANAILRGDR